MKVPNRTGNSVEKIAICRSTEAAQITRESMSRPRLSVPNGCAQVGGFNSAR